MYINTRTINYNEFLSVNTALVYNMLNQQPTHNIQTQTAKTIQMTYMKEIQNKQKNT
jgi:hypothetical protein